MDVFVECAECGFCLLGGNQEAPVPKRVESCPRCRSGEFEFAE